MNLTVFDCFKLVMFLESHSFYWTFLFVVLLVLPETLSSSMLLFGVVLAASNAVALLGMSSLLAGE